MSKTEKQVAEAIRRAYRAGRKHAQEAHTYFGYVEGGEEAAEENVVQRLTSKLVSGGSTQLYNRRGRMRAAAGQMYQMLERWAAWSKRDRKGPPEFTEPYHEIEAETLQLLSEIDGKGEE